ncbi:MAG: PEP-CTERM sorting domain-containing protein [Rubrivivax sp.]|nr:PEP-CTERM sorting domain-containing protein [Rubrivivax sp.]
MYCYDVYEHIGSGSVVNYTINLAGESARTLDFLGAVNHVLNQNPSTYDPYAWLHPGNGYVAAAIQLGIWESKYEDVNGAWDIADGSFRASELETATKGHLESFFGAIGNTASLDGKYVMTLEAHGAQDMITGDPPPTDVPEPGTLALLGAAVVGLVTTRRRAGTAAAAST